MKTPLAIANLKHQGLRTLVSISGVAFALLLVFMQLGFMGAVSDTATNVLEHLKFDAVIRARDYLHLYEPGQIERRWLQVAANTPGVERTEPVWITLQNWRKIPTAEESETDFTSKYLPIAVMAMQPSDEVFDLEQVRNAIASGGLSSPNDILVDEATQSDYGPWDGKAFSQLDLDRVVEIGSTSFAMRGTFQLGTGLAANGAVLMSHLGFAQVTPWSVEETTSLGLVQIRGNPQEVQQTIEQLRYRTRLMSSDQPTQIDQSVSSPLAGNQRPGDERPEDQALNDALSSDIAGAVAVLSREEALQHERRRWLWQTPIGLIFQLGVVLSLIVGAAIVYMVLSTDVANRLSEYATLLAMGYSRKYLASVVMTQAIVLCIFGFATAYALAEGLYLLTSQLSSIPLSMTVPRVVAVFILGLIMCCFSGMLALRKLWKAEPANLF